MTEPTLKSELSQLFFYDHRNGLNPFFYKIFANQANSSFKA